MKNVLISIDLSDFSGKIIDLSIEYLHIIKAKAYVIYVAPLKPAYILPDVGFQYLSNDSDDKIMKERKKQLLKTVEKIKNAGIECEGILKEGIPSDFILEAVMEKKIDLIIIGSHGHGTLYQALVGSVCHSVIKESQIPILLVPDNYRNSKAEA